MEFFEDEVPLKHYRQATVFVGDFFEELSAKAFLAYRLRTDARCICPDLARGDIVIEVKGVKAGGHVLHYTHRVARYKAFQQETGKRLVYAIWVHTTRAKDFKFKSKFIDALAQSVKALYLIDPADVHRLEKTRKVEDYTKAGYKPFFRMRYTDLGRWSRGVMPFQWRGLEAYGRQVAAFPVYTCMNDIDFLTEGA